MVQRPTLTALVTAMTTAAVAAPLERALKQLGAWDMPNERSSHDHPVPRAGGLAPLVGATAVAFHQDSTHLSCRASLIIGGLASLGLIDDISGHLDVRTRLLVQLGSGWALGGPRTWDHLLGAIVTTGVVNVTNFMDGINGISGMTALVWGMNAVLGPRTEPSAGAAGNGDEYILLGALVAGGALGFLPYNLPRARLFLGDVGSYSLGAAMAAGIMTRPTISDKYRAAAPLLLYAVDAAQALVHRRLKGEPIGQPHRDHVYQQLVDAGVGHGHVAALHAALSATISRAGYSTAVRKWATTSTLCCLYLLSPHVARRVVSLKRRRQEPATTQ